jgi:ATP-dependent DNA helicase RecG
MFLPVPKTDGRLTEGLSEGLKSVWEAIQNNEGIQANKISALLNNRTIKTIERQIKALVEKGSIERKGSKKTGGYFIKS